MQGWLFDPTDKEKEQEVQASGRPWLKNITHSPEGEAACPQEEEASRPRASSSPSTDEADCISASSDPGSGEETRLEGVAPEATDRSSLRGDHSTQEGDVETQASPSTFLEGEDEEEQATLPPMEVPTTDPNINKVKEEMQQAAERVANLAYCLKKNSALRDPARVAMAFWARWNGMTSNSKIAPLMGLAVYTTLDKYLRYGRERKAPVYVEFLNYWNYFMAKSIAYAQRVVQSSAHTSGKSKEAMEFLKMAAPEDYDKERAGGGVNVEGDINVLVQQEAKRYAEMDTEQLMRELAQLGNALPPNLTAQIRQNIRPEVAEDLGLEDGDA